MPFAAWLTIDALLVLLAVLSALAVALVVGAIRRGGRREDPIEDDAVASSRFTLPVSIIVPVDRELRGLSRTICSLLALNYPEIEVIVVADRLDGDAFGAFAFEWDLTPKEYFYRRTVQTSAVRRIFDSARDERLMVVDKETAGRADTLNCGLSLARFRYVATVAPGTVVDANTLLRLMAPALRDPARVLAATSHVERRWWTGAETAARGPLRRLWSRVEGDWQRLSSVRYWLASRITGRLRCGLAPQDSVIVWRRDTLVESGGFSGGAADPELDLLLRLERQEPATGGVVRTTEIVGRIEPVGLRGAARRGSLRHRAVLEAATALRSGRPWTDGHLAALCFVLAELLAPVAQAAVILIVIAGAAVGWFPWTNLVLLLVMLSFGNAAISVAALLIRGAVPGAPKTQALTRLLLLAPAEYVVYRPAVALARLGRPRD